MLTLLDNALFSALLLATSHDGAARDGFSMSRRSAVTTLGGITLALPHRFASAADEEITSTILETGDTSSPLPQRAQKVVVDYTLWINDFEGKQIDSSKGSAMPPKLPSPFAFNVGVGEVIKGWDQTVTTMHVGEKRRVVIPPELGYGAKGIGPIPGGAKLYFEIELLELRKLPQLSEKQLEWLAAHPE